MIRIFLQQAPAGRAPSRRNPQFDHVQRSVVEQILIVRVTPTVAVCVQGQGVLCDRRTSARSGSRRCTDRQRARGWRSVPAAGPRAPLPDGRSGPGSAPVRMIASTLSSPPSTERNRPIARSSLPFLFLDLGEIVAGLVTPIRVRRAASARAAGPRPNAPAGSRAWRSRRRSRRLPAVSRYRLRNCSSARWHSRRRPPACRA